MLATHVDLCAIRLWSCASSKRQLQNNRWHVPGSTSLISMQILQIGFFDANHAQCCTIRWVCSYSSHLLCKRNAFIVSQQSCSTMTHSLVNEQKTNPPLYEIRSGTQCLSTCVCVLLRQNAHRSTWVASMCTVYMHTGFSQ